MSTRANVIIKDERSQLIFYRHSDGYPGGVAKTLGEFVYLVRTNRLRDNVSQASGWLIVLGAEEYSDCEPSLDQIRSNTNGTGLIFKVGAYEPCAYLSPLSEYLYEIDLAKKTLCGWEYDGEMNVKIKDVTEELRKLSRKYGFDIGQ